MPETRNPQGGPAVPNGLNFIFATEGDIKALNGLADIVNDWAIKKGWNEDQSEMPERFRLMYRAEKLALIHSEVSECLEFLRIRPKCPECGTVWTPETGHHEAEQVNGMVPLVCQCGRVWDDPRRDDKVPSITGEAAELADVLIRVFHYCGEFGIDIGRALALKHAFNITRPYRHGKQS